MEIRHLTKAGSNVASYRAGSLTFANILFRKEIETPRELALKMGEVEACWSEDTP